VPWSSWSVLKAGDNLLWLSRLAWIRGRGQDARQLALEAVRVLEQLPPGPELAMAYSTMSQLYMLAEDGPAAVEWGQHALRIAEPLGLTETVAHTLNNVGTAELLMADLAGRAKLERSLELALAHGMHEHAARAYLNMAYQALVVRDYDRVQRLVADGLAYAREHDLDSYTLYALAERSRAYLEQGLWREAGDDASAVVRAAPGANSWLLAAAVLGCVRVRQGDPDAGPLLDEARERAWATGEIKQIGPMAATRGEAAWLAGDTKRARDELADAYELALRHPEPWRLGELGLWLWRAGALDRPLDGMALPYRLEIGGDWQGAAATWRRIGCPYEEALALAQGDRPARLRALDILTGLGAAPAAAMVRRNLRAEGARGIPRGPRAATRHNPLGLTTRQVDILALLAEDLSNKEIAARLRIAPKTVDHHVCAVLAKLEVSTRKQAAKHRVTRALLAKPRESVTTN
jgi:ATP/maltotriose-dependent transcriptional regulator MalT